MPLLPKYWTKKIEENGVPAAFSAYDRRNAACIRSSATAYGGVHSALNALRTLGHLNLRIAADGNVSIAARRLSKSTQEQQTSRHKRRNVASEKRLFARSVEK